MNTEQLHFLLFKATFCISEDCFVFPQSPLFLNDPNLIFYLLKNAGGLENVHTFCGQNGRSTSDEAEYLLHMTYNNNLIVNAELLCVL